MIAIAQLFAVTVDCPEPLALARFYQSFTGMRIVWSSDDFVALSDGVGVRIDFQRVMNPRPADWPDPDMPQRIHLDFRVDDLDSAEKEVLALGARPATHQPGGSLFRVLLDPAGHPFCLAHRAAAEIPDQQGPDE
jgi:catechol 2,3-dioxygenase-like lactoylglutathione lyase family enzyme